MLLCDTFLMATENVGRVPRLYAFVFKKQLADVAVFDKMTEISQIADFSKFQITGEVPG
jgi:hypothetical protein